MKQGIAFTVNNLNTNVFGRHVDLDVVLQVGKLRGIGDRLVQRFDRIVERSLFALRGQFLYVFFGCVLSRVGSVRLLRKRCHLHQFLSLGR